MTEDILDRAQDRLNVIRLGSSTWRETDKDLAVIRELMETVEELREIVVAGFMMKAYSDD